MDKGFSPVEEAADAKVQIQLINEELTSLLRGSPLASYGHHDQREDLAFLPPPVQSPSLVFQFGSVGMSPEKNQYAE